MNILKITFKSVKRRYRQIIRAALTTLFAVFFVTAVLIFQENMYQWQMQSNKDRFGDWFIMDIGSRQPDSNLTDHIYIEQPVKVSRSVNVLNDDWQSAGFYVGSFSSEFLAQSHIKLDEGRHPENSDEIAMDWNTLLTLGYKGEIGESINLKYCDNNSIGNKEKRNDKNYTLVGIYRNYTNIWNNGRQIPSAVVVDSELSQFNYDTRSVFLYPIKASIKTDDYKAVFDSIKEKTSKSYTYNSGVYDYKPWGSTSIYIYMYLIVMAIGITALSYQLIEYKNTRKASYKKYASLGADSSQLRRMYIIENALIIVPAALIGIITAFLAGGIVGGILEGKAGFSFYTINVSIVLKSIASVVIAVVVEEIVGLLSNVMDTVKEKRLKAGSKKQIVNIEVRNNNTSGRKSNLKVSNVSRVITSRLMKRDGVGMIIGVRLFSLFICVVLVFSVMKIATSFDKYKKNNSLPDIYGYLDIPSSNYRTDMIYISYLKDFDNYPAKSLNMDEFTQVDLINKEYNSRNRYPYDIPFFNKYNNSGKIDLQVELKDDDNPNTASTTYSFTQTDLEVETMFGACVAPQVAAVIKVTDEVKEDFNGIMPDYGYYTTLASTQLAKQAVDNQKDLMLRITGEGLTDGIDFELQYNQIKIDYDLSSTFSATNNKVALYLKSNNITYKSNVDSKNVYRTQLVNNILQYGITIMAVIIIQLLIMAIIIRNRIESRHGKFILFRKMGMTRGKLLGICMREALRESLWCIVTLPLMLILEVLIYSSNIRKL